MKIVSVKPMNDYRLFLEFDDGSKGEVSFENKVHRGVFRFLEDEENFNNVRIDGDGQFINWSNEVEITAEDLFEEMQDQKDEFL